MPYKSDLDANRIVLTSLCRLVSGNQATRERTFTEVSQHNLLPKVVARARAEGISTAVYEALPASQFAGGISKEDRIQLALEYEANRRRNQQIHDSVLELARNASERGIEVVALKGARWIFEDPKACAPWRRMIDVDLLVRPENYSEIRCVAERIGYRPMRREENIFGRDRFEGHYHLVALRCDKHTFVTEIHRHVGWQPDLLTTEQVFADGIPVATGLRLPSAWHAAFHAIIHWQIHHFGYRLGFHRITDGLDIARFMQRSDIDWDRLASHANTVGIARELNAALAMVGELFDVPIPHAATVPENMRTRVSKALKYRDSRLVRWKAKQLQRIDRLWHDHRYIYRARMRRKPAASIQAGLWLLRFRRLPFLASHVVSIGALNIAATLRTAVRSRVFRSRDTALKH